MRSFRIICLALVMLAGKAIGAPAAASDFKPEFFTSVYQPAKSRDPLLRIGGPVTPTAGQTRPTIAAVSFPFRLEGIQYLQAFPSAVINNTVVQLNKPVKLVAGGVEILVTAVEISRDRVVVEASGQKVELRLPRPKVEKPN